MAAKHCCCDNWCWEEACISGGTKSLHRWLLILFPLWLQLRLKVTHNVGICWRKSSQSLPVCVVLCCALSTPLIIPTHVKASAGGMHLLLSNSKSSQQASYCDVTNLLLSTFGYFVMLQTGKKRCEVNRWCDDDDHHHHQIKCVKSIEI